MRLAQQTKRLFFVALASAPMLVALSADAQQRGRTRAKDAGTAPTTTATTHKIEVGRDAGTEALRANADAGVVEAKTLDGGTRVFRFGEMEVEGRLRSPQIVYFLRRVRAEFAAGDLGHRSFMGELSETRKTNAF